MKHISISAQQKLEISCCNMCIFFNTIWKYLIIIEISFQHYGEFCLNRPYLFFHTPSFNQIILTPPPFQFLKLKPIQLNQKVIIRSKKSFLGTSLCYIQCTLLACTQLCVVNCHQSFQIRRICHQDTFYHSHEKTASCD